ncbi:MAG: toll/interleukin-1 receptor domain-containing protein [Caldimonas sp.]
MGSVFISYRREDSQGQARALFQDLVARLGRSAVFMDVDSIALGRDFREALQERLATCDLMLVLIGPGWLSGTDRTGRRRLDNPADYVCLEIAAALKRRIPIAPLLLQGAQMPTAEQLPESIRELAYRNGFELSHNRWDSDVQEMMKRLGLDARADAPPSDGPAPPAPAAAQPRKKAWIAIGAMAVLALAIAAGGLLYLGRPETAPEATVAAAPGADRAKAPEPTHIFDAADSQLRIGTANSYVSRPFTVENLDLDKDFRIEFQVRSTRKGGSTRYGIAWNYSPEDFLLFTLHSTGAGYFTIGPGRSTTRPAFSRLSEGPIEINAESGFDTLQMTRNGSALVFAVNGHEVWKTTDLRLNSPRFAFWAADFSEASIRSYTLRQ